jgi:hypothetical protein
MNKYFEKINRLFSNFINSLTSRITDRGGAQEIVITFGGIAIVMLVILVISFAKPVTEQLSETLFIEHHGAFSYQADARQGIYDQEYAQTGEPFFWDISENLDVEFSYYLNGISITNFSGTYQMTARLEDEHGWKRTLVTGEETAFTTFPATFELGLELDQIADIINSYQRQTNVSRNNYFLVIEPLIKVQGKSRGMDVQSQFSPELSFYITTAEFYLVNNDEITLNPEYIESATQLVEQGGTLSLFTLHVPVKVIRWVSLVFLVVALVFFGIYFIFYNKMLQREDPEGLAFRYGDWIVNVSNKPADEEMVWIEKFNDIVKMAEQYELVILHHQHEEFHYYYIKAPEGYFYYRLVE